MSSAFAFQPSPPSDLQFIDTFVGTSFRLDGFPRLAHLGLQIPDEYGAGLEPKDWISRLLFT